jgi:hypothetical protein
MPQVADSQLGTINNDPAAEAASPTQVAATAHRVRALRERHWAFLVVSAAIIVAACLLRFGEAGHLSVAGSSGLTLPTVCGSRLLFGIDCPGCGLTRSFVALAKGDLAASFRYHHLGWVLALAVLAQIPYRIWRLRELKTQSVERRWPLWFGQSLIVLLIGNWVGKMLGLW